jgi:hypothetical protein
VSIFGKDHSCEEQRRQVTRDTNFAPFIKILMNISWRGVAKKPLVANILSFRRM